MILFLFIYFATTVGVNIQVASQFLVPLTDLWSVSAILNPKQPKENKSFNFDYSYWSHTTVSFG